MVMSDDTVFAVGVTCSSWIVVVVSWITCCDQCGYVPMNFHWAGINRAALLRGADVQAAPTKKLAK